MADPTPLIEAYNTDGNGASDRSDAVALRATQPLLGNHPLRLMICTDT